jgi:hypothetical protein
MTKAYLIIPTNPVPPKGTITRTRLIVKTAPTGGASKARLIVLDKAFDNVEAGIRSALASANVKHHIFDTDIDGSETIDVSGAPKDAFDRLHAQPIPYFNKDDDNKAGSMTGFTDAMNSSFNGQKQRRLYLLIQLDATVSNAPSFDGILDAVESA